MTAGTSSTVSSPAFHADDPEQTSEYRTLSVLAIISLVFGLAAPLALASPLLIVLPLFGVAVSLLALRQIAANSGVLTGRMAAIAGLMLCVASAVAPTSRDLIFRAIRTSQAKKVSQEFLELVAAGDVEKAYRLTVVGAKPQTPPPPEPGAPPQPPKQTPYQLFLAQSVIQPIKAAGANSTIRYVDTVTYEPSTYRNIKMEQHFAVTPASGGQPVDVIVTVHRTQLRGESMSRWLVSRCDDAKTVAAAGQAQ